MRKQFGAYVGCYSLDINHTWFIALGLIAGLVIVCPVFCPGNTFIDLWWADSVR